MPANAKRCSRKPTCVMLINEIAKLFHERMREKCERLNFKPTYQAILRVVAHEPGLSQLEIAGRVHLAPPTVSLALQKMEAEDLIRREPDARDLRQVLVHLTDKGREMDDIMRHTAETTDKLITKGLTREELETIYPILMKMHDNIAEGGQAK